MQQKLGLAHDQWRAYRATSFEERAERMHTTADLFEQKAGFTARLMTTEMDNARGYGTVLPPGRGRSGIAGRCGERGDRFALLLER
ncbi:hypothetical protein [Nonomuraea sp. NPDC049695]|uniref:hypothetical protein n=1 Tax=Nonomuraea sp. NPDC049695 TaxID=3154734 RepID=UPI0034366D67